MFVTVRFAEIETALEGIPQTPVTAERRARQDARRLGVPRVDEGVRVVRERRSRDRDDRDGDAVPVEVAGGDAADRAPDVERESTRWATSVVRELHPRVREDADLSVRRNEHLGLGSVQDVRDDGIAGAERLTEEVLRLPAPGPTRDGVAVPLERVNVERPARPRVVVGRDDVGNSVTVEI